MGGTANALNVRNGFGEPEFLSTLGTLKKGFRSANCRTTCSRSIHNLRISAMRLGATVASPNASLQRVCLDA